MALYLLIATVFYTTKNICDTLNPLQCYGYFCAGFIIIFTINTAVNRCIIKGPDRKKLWGWKIGLLVIPIIIFLFSRYNN